MDAWGHIQNVVVVLDEGAYLPEGARVYVSVTPTRSTPQVHQSPVPRAVVLPIFDFDGPPDIDLTNERIAEILDRDDASA